jgi:hypothetical protein
VKGVFFLVGGFLPTGGVVRFGEWRFLCCAVMMRLLPARKRSLILTCTDQLDSDPRSREKAAPPDVRPRR